MTVAFSAAVLCSTRRLAAAVTIVAVLVAAAAETEAGAVFAPATVAAKTDLAVLCLVPYVHPVTFPIFLSSTARTTLFISSLALATARKGCRKSWGITCFPLEVC